MRGHTQTVRIYNFDAMVQRRSFNRDEVHRLHHFLFQHFLQIDRSNMIFTHVNTFRSTCDFGRCFEFNMFCSPFVQGSTARSVNFAFNIGNMAVVQLTPMAGTCEVYEATLPIPTHRGQDKRTPTCAAHLTSTRTSTRARSQKRV